MKQDYNFTPEEIANRDLWFDIPNFSNYQVSDLGKVRALPKKVKTYNGTRTTKAKILNPWLHRGKPMVKLVGDDGVQHAIYVDRLVLRTFKPNLKETKRCIHKDKDPLNNRLENLSWENKSTKENKLNNILVYYNDNVVLAFKSTYAFYQYLKNLGLSTSVSSICRAITQNISLHGYTLKLTDPKTYFKEQMKLTMSPVKFDYLYSAKINQPVRNTSKPVVMLDLNNNYIKTFKSISEASRYFHTRGYPSASNSTIRNCLNGRYKTAYGFKWITLEEYNTITDTST